MKHILTLLLIIVLVGIPYRQAYSCASSDTKEVRFENGEGDGVYNMIVNFQAKDKKGDLDPTKSYSEVTEDDTGFYSAFYLVDYVTHNTKYEKEKVVVYSSEFEQHFFNLQSRLSKLYTSFDTTYSYNGKSEILAAISDLKGLAIVQQEPTEAALITKAWFHLIDTMNANGITITSRKKSSPNAEWSPEVSVNPNSYRAILRMRGCSPSTSVDFSQLSKGAGSKATPGREAK